MPYGDTLVYVKVNNVNKKRTNITLEIKYPESDDSFVWLTFFVQRHEEHSSVCTFFLSILHTAMVYFVVECAINIHTTRRLRI